MWQAVSGRARRSLRGDVPAMPAGNGASEGCKPARFPLRTPRATCWDTPSIRRLRFWLLEADTTWHLGHSPCPLHMHLQRARLIVRRGKGPRGWT